MVDASANEMLESILERVAARSGVNFADYRRDTIVRGIKARCTAHGVLALDAYARMLEDEREVVRLVEAMLVPVSTFFRDSEVFAALGNVVLPDLQHRIRGALRVWSVGCATGEEAWSLAMLCAEAQRTAGLAAFEILGSDIDTRSLAVARNASYDRIIARDVPEALATRYLERVGDRSAIAQSLREHVVFAEHDVMGHRVAPKESVVPSFDLIALRNVLIYFDRRLQQKALERLLSLLTPGGAIVLGSVETMPQVLADRTEPYPGTDASWSIFRKKAV